MSVFRIEIVVEICESLYVFGGFKRKVYYMF